MTGNPEKVFEYMVSADNESVRLDVLISSQLGLDLSRAQIQRLIREGGILVNGRLPNKTGVRMKIGDMIRVTVQSSKPEVQAEALPLSVVYEDKYLLVVDKPAGMVVHPAPGNYSGTLVNALLHHCKNLAEVGESLRPGIVHRLDKDTSGLLVVAKTMEAYRGLIRQMKLRQVSRIYLTLAKGNITVESGVVDAPIGRHQVMRKKMAVISEGKQAITYFQVLARFPGYTFLEVKLETGRTHQIRVHLAYIGHPVVGDLVYGREKNKMGLDRQALHAAQLKFTHPVTGQELSFTSPLPKDIKEALNQLKNLNNDILL